MEYFYTAVKLSQEEWASGKVPHNQPGVDLRFYDTPSTLVEQTLRSDDTLALSPQIFAFFTVPESAIQDYPRVSTGDALSQPGYEGVLPVKSITQCQIVLNRDALNLSQKITSQHVPEGALPDYAGANSLVTKRIHSFYVLDQILKNTDPELSQQIREGLTKPGTRAVTPEQIEKLSGVDLYVHALRTTLNSSMFNVHQLYNTGKPQIFNGIMYTSPIGMDLTMRTVQQVMLHMAPRLDAQTIVALPHLYEALSKHTYSTKDSELVSSQTEAVIKHIQGALNEFKGHVDPKIHEILEDEINSVPRAAMYSFLKMQHPAAEMMHTAMVIAASLEQKKQRLHISADLRPNMHNDATVLAHFAKELSKTDTSLSLNERITAAAQQTLNAVSADRYHNHVPGNEAPEEQNTGENDNHEDVGDDAK